MKPKADDPATCEPAGAARAPDRRVWRWRERAGQWLDFPLGRFLDYGCGHCGLLEKVRDHCEECHGVDVNDDVIAGARERFPEFRLSVIDQSGRTAYADDFFDTVALIEVIEHVPDERRTLREIARILKPNGKLILTTPHKGTLTFLDLGNFKFVFPTVHRFIHVVLLRNKGYYEARFVRTREVGLVGDISESSDRRAWHRHYKPAEIVDFCPPELRLERDAVYFPGMRAFMLLSAVLRVVTAGLVRRLPWPLSAVERALGKVQSRAGDQLVMRFTKVETTP